MTSPRRRETRAEADERIVAEMRWETYFEPHLTALIPVGEKPRTSDFQRYATAAARILNRIARKRGKEGE